MSTKIYEAYRLKKNVSLFNFVRDARALGEAAVKGVFRKIYTELAETAVNTDSDEYKKALESYDGNETLARYSMAHELVRKGYKAQLGDPFRNFFNFDVSIVFREYQNRFYLIPIGDGRMRESLDFLKKHPNLEDFAYWNNTDRPDNVSAQAWRRRAKVWNEMDRIDWRASLVLHLCDWDGFYSVDPYYDMLERKGPKK